MLEYLPDIGGFLFDVIGRYWALVTGCSVLAGFLALTIVKRIFRILDVIRR